MKRLVALLLCLVMLSGMMPGNIFYASAESNPPKSETFVLSEVSSQIEIDSEAAPRSEMMAIPRVETTSELPNQTVPLLVDTVAPESPQGVRYTDGVALGSQAPAVKLTEEPEADPTQVPFTSAYDASGAMPSISPSDGFDENSLYLPTATIVQESTGLLHEPLAVEMTKAPADESSAVLTEEPADDLSKGMEPAPEDMTLVASIVMPTNVPKAETTEVLSATQTKAPVEETNLQPLVMTGVPDDIGINAYDVTSVSLMSLIAPLKITVTLDKASVTIGETVTASYAITGGEWHI